MTKRPRGERAAANKLARLLQPPTQREREALDALDAAPTTRSSGVAGSTIAPDFRASRLDQVWRLNDHRFGNPQASAGHA